jgi:hypothetical protein
VRRNSDNAGQSSEGHLGRSSQARPFGYVLPCSSHEQNQLLCIHPMLILGKTAGAAKTQLHALDGEETSHLAENIPPIASLNFPVGCLGVISGEVFIVLISRSERKKRRPRRTGPGPSAR